MNLERWRNGPTWRQWLILVTVFVAILNPWLWLIAIFVWPVISLSAKRTTDGKLNDPSTGDGSSNIP